MATALARRRTRARIKPRSSSAALQKLSSARASLARSRKKYQSSARRSQYSQLAWTLGGGAAAGAATGMMPDIMGIDTRLVAGLALAAVSLAVKAPAIQQPACGLASGLLASYISDTVGGLTGADDLISDNEDA